MILYVQGFIAFLVTCIIGAAFSAGPGAASASRPVDAPSSYILRAGVLYTGDSAPLRDVSLVIRNGKVDIVRTGDAALPSDLPVIDRSDATIIPGFIASETTLADAFEERFPNPTFGTVVTFRTIDPLRRAIDGFSFLDRRDALLASGVTTVFLAPGQKRLVNGRGAVVKLAGDNAAERTLRELADLSISIGDAPKNPPSEFEAKLPPSAENRIDPAIPQMPRSRAGAAFAIREAFAQAREHAKASRDAKSARQKPPFDPELLSLAGYLEAKQRVRVRTNASVDAATALTLMAENGLGGTLVGGVDADVHSGRIKDADVGVIIEIPASVAPVPNVNTREPFRPDPARTAAKLATDGVRVAITPADDAQLANWNLMMSAAMRAGMTPEQIVRATTDTPARLLGVQDRVGVLAPGRDADFIVLNGTPGEPTTSVRETWVNGLRVFDREDVDRRRREAKKVEATGESLVVRAGLVLPMSGEPIPNGSVAIHNGKIVAVGREVAVPRGARVIDAGPNAVITPGLIDARSFLGLEGDPTAFGGNVNLQFLAVPQNPDFRAVADGGVTTVLVQSVNPTMPGSPIAALKTGGSANGAVIREVCGLSIPTQGNNPESYRSLLKRGKDYTDRWDKYFSDFDKFKEDAKKAPADTKKDDKADAKKDEQKPDSKADENANDPVTGTWEGELWGGPIPRREPFTLKLKLKGDTISGSFSSRSPLARGETEFEGGKYKDNTISISIVRSDVPFPLNIEAKIDRADHMAGRVDARVLTLDFEASRTEKAAPTIAIKSTAKKKGGPEVPPIDETLEPYRRLMKNDAALVVRADLKADIENAITVVFDEFKLPLVIWGGADAGELAPAMATKKIGVLSGPNLLPSKTDSALPLVTELAMAGVPIAIGSESNTGAARFVDLGFSVVSRGFGAESALRAFTIDAARMFKIDARVGSLEHGKDGDLVIWTGMPFKGSSAVQAVVIGGEIVYKNE